MNNSPMFIHIPMKRDPMLNTFFVIKTQDQGYCPQQKHPPDYDVIYLSLSNFILLLLF
jgi:hypothetical protein